MRSLLTLERSHDGEVVERRQQWSKSFTRALMQLLYVQYAQIQMGAPYVAKDIMGQNRSIDTQKYCGAKGNLRMVAPSGYGTVFVPTGSGVNTGSYVYQMHFSNQFLAGSLLGIVVGGDNTPVDPTDFALKQRIFHGQGASVAGPATFDNVTTGDNTQSDVSSSQFRGLIFSPLRGFRMSSFKFLMYRSGSPGTVTAYLYGVRANNVSQFTLDSGSITSTTTNGDTLPTGSPYEWREFTLASPMDINPGLWYAIIMAASGGGSAYIRVNNAANNRRYALVTSMTGYTVASCPMFDLRGSAQGELEYSGSEIFGLAIANPNGQFSLRRMFTNNSGMPIDIQEAGIYAAGTQLSDYISEGLSPKRFGGSAWPFCIARDVIAPAINVPNGQVLQVTYTPQITV